jgi:hypothetical protein
MTFEFTYKRFEGRIVFNPGDIMMRMEHQETLRVYEQIFFAQSFSDFEILGGLEFIERFVRNAFSATSKEFVVDTFVVSPTVIHMIMKYTSDLLPKPLKIQMDVPVVKRSSANIDLETLERRVKAVDDRIAAVEGSVSETAKTDAKIRELGMMVSEMSGLFAAMQQRVVELEERCGDYIILTGCSTPIPITATTVTLVRDKTSLDELGYYWIGAPGKKVVCTTNEMWNGASRLKYITPIWDYIFAPGSAQSFTWTDDKSSYVFSSLPSIKQLKYLNKVTSLTISGANERIDYSVIGSLVKLRQLTICGSRFASITHEKKTISTERRLDPSMGMQLPYSNPSNLTDISWITSLKSLTHVSFVGCTNLVNIAPLAELPNLQHLDIRETGVKNTSFLSNPRLTIVTA